MASSNSISSIVLKYQRRLQVWEKLEAFLTPSLVVLPWTLYLASPRAGELGKWYAVIGALAIANAGALLSIVMRRVTFHAFYRAFMECNPPTRDQ